MFVLHSGLIVLKNKLHSHKYSDFKFLVYALRILINPAIC